MKFIRVMAVAAATSLLTVGCGGLPHATAPTDTHTVYVWPLDRCPSVESAPNVERSPLLASVVSILTGDLISALVAVPANALAEAADADKKGFTATGSNPRFYYRQTKDNQNKLVLRAPGCYVVAYAKPSVPASSWCDDKTFSAGLARSCANGKALIDGLLAKDALPGQVEPKSSVPSLPEFYAEIAFDRSGYDPVMRPWIAALYYPKSLHDPNSSSKRTVTLSLTLTAPGGGDALKAASVAITLPGIEPGKVTPATLTSAQTGWTSLPDIKLGSGVDKEGVYFPITIAATLHEIGDPSVFLAAFSKAVSNSTGDITKAISNAVLPEARAAAEMKAQNDVASYYTAYQAAVKANADYLAACAKPPTTPAEKEAAQALYYGVSAARWKANIAADIASARRFDNTEPDTRCF